MTILAITGEPEPPKPEDGWYNRYKDIDTSIYDMTTRLRKYYIEQGLTSIRQIGLKYAPLNDSRNGVGGMDNKKWIPKVEELCNKMLNENEKLMYK